MSHEPFVLQSGPEAVVLFVTTEPGWLYGVEVHADVAILRVQVGQAILYDAGSGYSATAPDENGHRFLPLVHTFVPADVIVEVTLDRDAEVDVYSTDEDPTLPEMIARAITWGGA